jgi:RimJ/RimL family protein N-acetyltransferase
LLEGTPFVADGIEAEVEHAGRTGGGKDVSRDGGANAARQRFITDLVDEMEIRLNFWQGKKVRLRGIEPSDADVFFAWNMDSDMARRLDFVWPPVSQAQVKKEIEEQAQKKLEHDSFTWVIEDTSGAAVGSIKTHICDARNGTFSYGVSVVREHQRKGYAAEAIQMVLKYYFEELRYQKVSVAVHSYNEESIALHEKLGFVREGTLRRMVYTRGEYFDVHWYGMTNEEWERSAEDE